MSSYRYAVKVKHLRHGFHTYGCQGCGVWIGCGTDRATAAMAANHHAANCEQLHRANWDAACPSCKAFGKIAPACPQCLGKGWVK